MAGKARENLVQYGNTTILCGNFDTIEMDLGRFDLIVAATSFHWLDSETRKARIASLLKPMGKVAIIETSHVDMKRDTFPVTSQACYIR